MSREVVESGRAVLRCKYLPATDTRGEGISVRRFDPPSYGSDPNRVVVAWDYALGFVGNYVAAVQEYVDKADWSGTWVVSTVTDGAVAVCVPNTHKVGLPVLVESYEILDELEMLHLLSTGQGSSGDVLVGTRVAFEVDGNGEQIRGRVTAVNVEQVDGVPTDRMDEVVHIVRADDGGTWAIHPSWIVNEKEG